MLTGCRGFSFPGAKQPARDVDHCTVSSSVRVTVGLSLITAAISIQEGVRRHTSGSSEVPLKNYDVTKSYSETLRGELKLLQNIGEASVMSAPLFASHIKQLVINQLCRFCELYFFWEVIVVRGISLRFGTRVR